MYDNGKSRWAKHALGLIDGFVTDSRSSKSMYVHFKNGNHFEVVLSVDDRTDNDVF